MPVSTLTQPRHNGASRHARPINSFAGFANAVIRASQFDDPTAIAGLQAAAPSTYGNEGTGVDGGFLLPDSLAERVAIRVSEEGDLSGLCDTIEVPQGNSVLAAQDDSTPWGTDGVIATWAGEGTEHPHRKPQLRARREFLHKMSALIPVSGELREDAAAMGAYFARKLASITSYGLNRVILAGDGVAKPLGVLNSPATIAVAKESGQAADTIVSENLRHMWAGLTASSKASPSLRWVVHPDAEAAVFALDDRMVDPGRRTIMGARVIVTEACEKLGDKGDIYLADLREYLLPRRIAQLAESIHLWFDYDISCFRYTLRVSGGPWPGAPVTSRVGSGTRSPFVVLADRA